MMIDRDKKAEVRFYYETHEEEAAAVARRFNIAVRTMSNWVKNEKWERGKGLKKVMESDIKEELVKKEFGSVVEATAKRVKENIKASLGDTYYNLNELVQNNLLDNVTDELLMQAMGINFLQKNMALGMLIAKDEMKRMLSLRREGRPEPQLIAAAEKYVSIAATLQKSFYPNNEASLNLNVVNINEDLSKLSQADILARIKKIEEGEAPALAEKNSE